MSSVHLTTTTYVRRSGRITNGMRSGRTSPQDSAFSSPTPAPTPPEWPSQKEPGSGLTASAPLLDISAPACTNVVWPPLRPVSVAQKNKPSTMLSSNFQSIDFLMDRMAWRFWAMRQSNGCSISAPRSSVAKQCFEQLAQKKVMQIPATQQNFCHWWHNLHYLSTNLHDNITTKMWLSIDTSKQRKFPQSDPVLIRLKLFSVLIQ